MAQRSLPRRTVAVSGGASCLRKGDSSRVQGGSSRLRSASTTPTAAAGVVPRPTLSAKYATCQLHSRAWQVTPVVAARAVLDRQEHLEHGGIGRGGELAPTA